MSFKVRPLNEMIPIIMDAIKDDYDLPIHKELPATESPMILKIKEQHNRIKILEEALRDILAIPNSEAAQGIMKVVAKAALARAGVTERLMPDPHAETGTDEKDAVLVPQEGSSNG